jgi:hypothetical protein
MLHAVESAETIEYRNSLARWVRERQKVEETAVTSTLLEWTRRREGRPMTEPAGTR